jgi:hypothetical protein
MGKYLDLLAAARHDINDISDQSPPGGAQAVEIQHESGCLADTTKAPMPCDQSPPFGRTGDDGGGAGVSGCNLTVNSGLRAPDWGFGRISRFGRTFSALEQRCPDHVELRNWQQAVEDGRSFLQWGEQAVALGWTPADLFGLCPVPENPHPSFNRLSRYDQAGLMWLLYGRPVIALTERTAIVRTPSGGTLTYYKRTV